MKKRRSGFTVMARLIGLVKPLTGHMLLAVLLGLLGHLCAAFITIFGGYAVLTVLQLEQYDSWRCVAVPFFLLYLRGEDQEGGGTGGTALVADLEKGRRYAGNSLRFALCAVANSPHFFNRLWIYFRFCDTIKPDIRQTFKDKHKKEGRTQ